ncbi:baculoviral IAP repeat-containing protein 2 [Biomphalaria glabrata]|nr:baculoviral IAP repeat-containing protein 2 [Biomphalaria glabrata]
MFFVYRAATSWRKLPGSYQMRKTFKSSSSRTSEDSEKTKNQQRNNLLQENLKFSTRSEFLRTSQLLFGFLRVQEPANKRRMVCYQDKSFVQLEGYGLSLEDLNTLPSQHLSGVPVDLLTVVRYQQAIDGSSVDPQVYSETVQAELHSSHSGIHTVVDNLPEVETSQLSSANLTNQSVGGSSLGIGHRRVVLQPETDTYAMGNENNITPPSADINRSLGAIQCRVLRSFEHSLYQRRLNTFRGMEETFAAADYLARAGFYYAGIGDAVICFCCGGGLRSIARDSDFCYLHAKYYPGCAYINLLLGASLMEFIQRNQAMDESSFNPSSIGAPIYNHVEEDVNLIAPRLRCRNCQTRRTSLLFLPCGHLRFCLQCGIRVLICYVCKSRVSHCVSVLSSR